MQKLTVDEYAKMKGITPAAVYYQIEHGHVKSVKEPKQQIKTRDIYYIILE